MKHYHGCRGPDGTAGVRVVEQQGGDAVVMRALPLRLDLCNHSPTGFEWGYGGSGPAQLALAILADVFHNDQLAVRLHQDFKWMAIAPLAREAPWQMSENEVRHIVGMVTARKPAKPPVLMRQPDKEVVRICGDCGEYLAAEGLLVADELGILEMAPGVTFEQVRATAMAHHGPSAGTPMGETGHD
jgi:hypothetical protein